MRDTQQVLDALSSPIRREILTLIWERELPAGEIAAAFEVTAPTISQHLAVLREAELVSVVVDGNFRRYRARQDAVRGLRGALFDDPAKWEPADDIPESELANVRTVPLVIAAVDVDVDVDRAFRAFTDPVVYSRWLGVPVRIDGNRFSCSMEWGTTVRGTYDLVLPPSLIAIRWDFEDDNIPLPGSALPGYIRFDARGAGTRVEVQQIVDTVDQAAFMQSAWGLVLGRLQSGVMAASSGTARVEPRARRAKRRTPR